MLITVNEKDIKKGRRNGCGKGRWHNTANPVSLALGRTFKYKGEDAAASVCDIFILVDKTGDGLCASWPMPKKVENFIDALIAGKKVEPFSFTLPDKKFGTLHLAGEED